MPRYQWEGRYECTTGGSNKFYNIRQTSFNSEMFDCTYGAIGSTGTTTRKNYIDVMKKVNGFRSKGYRKISETEDDLINAISQLGNNTGWTRQKTIPKTEKPIAPKSRLHSIDEDEDIKTEEVKPEEPKPKGRLGSI